MSAGRVLLEGNVVHVHDVRSDPEYSMRAVAAAEMLGVRTILGVPIMREGVPIGFLCVMRRTVRPFSEKQIELLSTFADQAVIAIENTRLFEAEQQRTRELAESLEQQTATVGSLRVISTSPGDFEPVFASDAGERYSHLRSKVRQYLSLRRRGFRTLAAARCTASLR